MRQLRILFKIALKTIIFMQPDPLTIPEIPASKLESIGKLFEIIYQENMDKGYGYPFREKVSSYGIAALDAATEFLDKELDAREIRASADILREYVAALREFEKQPSSHWKDYNALRGIKEDAEISTFLDDAYLDTLYELVEKASPHMKSGFNTNSSDESFSRILYSLPSRHGDAVIPLNSHIDDVMSSCFWASKDIESMYNKGLEGFYRMGYDEKKEVLKNMGMKVMWKIPEKIADKITSRTIFHPRLDNGAAMAEIAAASAGAVGLSCLLIPPIEGSMREGSIAYWQYANPAIADAMVTDAFIRIVFPMLPVVAIGFSAYSGAKAVNSDRKLLGKVEAAVAIGSGKQAANL